MSEVRNFIGRFDNFSGRFERFVHIAHVDAISCIVQSAIELNTDGRIVVHAVGSWDPLRLQCLQAFLRLPITVGENDDRVLQPHDLLHALHHHRTAGVHVLQRAAGDGAMHDRPNQHARNFDVDAVLRGAVDFCGRVDTARRRAD